MIDRMDSFPEPERPIKRSFLREDWDMVKVVISDIHLAFVRLSVQDAEPPKTEQ